MQGTVYRLERNMAMIWTSDDYLVRIRKQSHFAVGDLIRFTSVDLLQAPGGRRSVLSYRQIGTILASVFLGLALLFYSLQSVLAGFFLPPPVVLVAVDINPSVLFSVAADGTVVSVAAQNQDARDLKLKSLTGQPLATALASVVSQVTDAGIIDPADGIMDYVVVTTVDLGNHDETTQALAGSLDQAAIQNRTLSAVNLVLTTADEAGLDQARTQSVPLGLVALADQTGIDTTGETVKSFFADPEHVQALEVQSAGGQLLRVKPKTSQPVQLLTVSQPEMTGIAPVEPVPSQENSGGKKVETPAATSPAAEKKAETPAATSPAAEKKAETPAATSPAAEKKAETPAATSPAAEKKAETPAATSPAAEKKAETPAVTSPAAEKKAETPAVTSPSAEKKAETPAATSPAVDKNPDIQQAPGQVKKQQ